MSITFPRIVPNEFQFGRKKRLPAKLGAMVEFLEGEEKGRQVPLAYEKTILGRKFADILVRDIKVSSSHVAIEYHNRKFRIVDLGSTNGTFLGDRKIQESSLDIGQKVKIGESVFRIILDPESATKLLEGRPIDLKAHIGGLSALIEHEFIQEDIEVVNTATMKISPQRQSNVEQNIELEIISGNGKGQRFSFSKQSISIGRVQSDLILHDPDVSRKHVLLEKGEGEQIILRDLASTNGTFVNDRRVTNCVLSVEDRIRVGQTTIVFRGVRRQ